MHHHVGLKEHIINKSSNSLVKGSFLGMELQWSVSTLEDARPEKAFQVCLTNGSVIWNYVLFVLYLVSRSIDIWVFDAHLIDRMMV